LREYSAGLKILVLTADYPPRAWSGIAAAASNHALALADAGADVSVLTRFQPPSTVSTSPRLQVCSLDEPRFPFRGAGFNWINLHSLALGELAFELRRRYRMRIAYTAHSVIFREIADGPVRRFWSDLQFRVMRECDALILVSESEREIVFGAAPDIGRRAHVIPNAVPAPPSCIPPYQASGPVVFAGRFTASKGMATLRGFLPSLHDKRLGQIVLAGGHGDAEGNRAIHELRTLLGDALSTPGWLNRAELDNLFAAASLVLVPSCYEPFGMVAVEAMRLGVPVLAARVGGLAEIACAGSGGRLVGSRRPDAWRDQALDILHDETAAEELARRGPGYVQTRFHPSLIAGRLLREVYAN
jgi:1,4-alpha-glucan branching enzyme